MSEQEMSEDLKSYLESIPKITQEQYEELLKAAAEDVGIPFENIGTPRTDAAYKDSTKRGIYELFNESKNLERELFQSKRIIQAQYRGVQNSERILCEALGVNDGSEILDAIQALKERVKRLEQAGDAMAWECTNRDAIDFWKDAKEAA